MGDIAAYSQLLQARAEWLVLALVLAAVLGEWPARLSGLAAVFSRGNRLLAALARRLDKPARGAATIIYRGMIALLLVLLVGLALGALLVRIAAPEPILAVIPLMLWLGYALAPYGGWQLWQRARRNTTPLELPGIAYVFADGHAVIRYSIEQRAWAFAVGVVGAGFWYVAGGLPLMALYLVVAAAHQQFRRPLFGWAAHYVFMLLNALPQLMARVVMLLAGVLTPQARPLAALSAANWRLFIAQLLHVSLGGPGPMGDLPWVGTGSARVSHGDLRRVLVLQGVATVLLLLLAASPEIFKLLIIII